MSRMPSGSSRDLIPDVERAAHAGLPVACIAARQVSRPSPTISTLAGAPSLTTPLRQGPSIIFCGATGALPVPSGARYVRWIPTGVLSMPRVTSPTIAGQIPPLGCFNPEQNRSAGGGDKNSLREAKYFSARVSSAGADECQMPRAARVRFPLSRSELMLAGIRGVGRGDQLSSLFPHSPRDSSAAITLSCSHPAKQ